MYKQNSTLSFQSEFSEFLRNRPPQRGYLLAKGIEQNPEFKNKIESLHQHDNKNIFQDPLNLKVCELDPNIGPKYTNNKIVSRSIVGKPEIFRKRAINIMITQKQESEPVKIISTERKRISTKQSFDLRKPEPKKELVTINDLEVKINDLEKKLFINKQIEVVEQSKLPFEIKQNYYRDARALQLYEKQTKEQDQIMIQNSATLSRDPSKSVMLEVYQFRKKKEQAYYNDGLANQCLYNTKQILEVDDESNNPYLFLSSDRQEVIRKPSIYNQDETVNSILKSLSDDKAFNSFTTNDYIQFQYSKFKKLALDKIQIHPEELVVLGQSKLQSELNVDKNQRYILGKLDQKNDEEVIEEKYSPKFRIRYQK
ncbi:hypothetical protein pb186bvf_004316 [Paramecium bursaria]